MAYLSRMLIFFKECFLLSGEEDMMENDEKTALIEDITAKANFVRGEIDSKINSFSSKRGPNRLKAFIARFCAARHSGMAVRAARGVRQVEPPGRRHARPGDGAGEPDRAEGTLNRGRPTK